MFICLCVVTVNKELRRKRNMTQQKITEQTIFYRIYPERKSQYGDYLHREIGIYSISTYDVEHQIDQDTNYFGLNPGLTLTYQKCTDKNEHASENMKQNFFGERIDDCQIKPNAEGFLKVSRLFDKMEKAYKKLSEQGLTLQNVNDAYQFRLFLLKKIGALQVEYSSGNHGFYISA